MTSSGADHPDGWPSRQDAGTPIYEELVRVWRAEGREVPQPQTGGARRGPGEPKDYFGRG
ncbi:hypothetical protein [Streptomyces sp. enrichment culture]|uniref:hypothetical protein n=1 Tax=Streptomyces sp. enrichment culture TaxID=1795815 RepID=UPI003F5651C8